MSELTKKLKIFFRSLHPRFWIMNYPYSKSWDRELNELLDNHKFDYDSFDGYWIRLGDKLLWCCNHPYGSFNNVCTIGHKSVIVRPSIKTLLRIEDIMKNENIKLF